MTILLDPDLSPVDVVDIYLLAPSSLTYIPFDSHLCIQPSLKLSLCGFLAVNAFPPLN